MCWNQEVSINTFLFSSFVLLLIIYNNHYTQYKIQELNNIWVYMLLFSIFLVQLIEFFLWRNLHNKFYNHLFSLLNTINLFLQPIFSIMIISNKNIRNILFSIYSTFMILLNSNKILSGTIKTTVSKNKNLQWDYVDYSHVYFVFVWIFWLFFFCFSFFYEKKWIFIFISLLLLLFVSYKYYKDYTVGSMWCWISNSIMIYYAMYLLIYLPFCEKQQLIC